jgi:cytochrome P450
VNSDPPAHTRIRKLCGQAFKPTAVAAWEPEIRAVADRLIDGFIAAGHVDLVSRFAEPLPGLVMCRLLDIADEDAPKFVGWVNHVVRLFDPTLPKGERLAACRSSADFYAFCEEEIRRRRQTPQRDFITMLFEARSDDGEGEPMLSQREVVSVLSQVLLAGIESKSLRHTDPVKGLFRRTTCDVELGGVTIPSGALVMAMWASGNRDEEVFNSPDKFNIFRTDIDRHIAFNRGPHSCLGVPLARLERRVALERLLSRLPNLRRADQRPTEWVSSLTTQGPQRLDVTWGT